MSIYLKIGRWVDPRHMTDQDLLLVAFSYILKCHSYQSCTLTAPPLLSLASS